VDDDRGDDGEVDVDRLGKMGDGASMVPWLDAIAFFIPKSIREPFLGDLREANRDCPANARQLRLPSAVARPTGIDSRPAVE